MVGPTSDPKYVHCETAIRGYVFADVPGTFTPITNGYCHKDCYCCKDVPWFEVYTGMGKLIIGWRKRIISLDWSQSSLRSVHGLPVYAQELFPDEQTTKEECLIHCWGYRKARECVNRLMVCYLDTQIRKLKDKTL